MYGHLHIRRGDVTVIYKASAYDAIYDTLRSRGYDHEDAEDIASWAELASIGDEYTGTDDEIWLSE